jgi:predicted transcriptional regulator of viral defense system
MKNQFPQLGKLGTAFFSLVQTRHLAIVYIGDLQEPLRLTADQEQQLLKRLTRNGFIIRLARGVFLVPNKIPAGGFWQPNSNYIILKLMEYYKAKYYVGGLSAIQYYGLQLRSPMKLLFLTIRSMPKKL